jgi:hypothetical protein
VVHESEVTLTIWFVVSLLVLFATQRALSFSRVDALRFPRAGSVTPGGPTTPKNSRSTRRERRIQQSVSTVV